MIDPGPRHTEAGRSFYVTGGTMAADAPSYVERQADHDLYEALTRGEYCYVLHARQMGKSSLMVRTALRLCQTGGSGTEAIAVAILDLAAIGQNVTAAQWYESQLRLLAQELEREREMEAFLKASADLPPLQRWLVALQAILDCCPDRIVIFIDEIDAVRNLPFSTDEFFAALRECYNRRARDRRFHRLTFCLMGVASPADLIQDVRTAPFNIGRRIELTDFTAAEAAPLAHGLGWGPGTNDQLLQRILYWTGGHPYLTQRLCQAVAADPKSREPAAVDRLCEALFLSASARERDDNLLFVRERLLRNEAVRASVLDLYGQVRAGKRVRVDDTNPLTDLLRLSGIARLEDGCLRVRNRIYERVFDRSWVVEHMPDAELRRQRAAYRRGLWRAAVVSASLLAVMGGLTLAAVYQARRAGRGERLARQNQYYANMNLAQQDWESNNMDRLRQSLIETQDSEARGLEWAYWLRRSQRARLTLWGHEGIVYNLSFSPDGRRLISGDHWGYVKIWDTQSGRDITDWDARPNSSLPRFSPDGKRIVLGCWDGSIRIMDTTLRREFARLRGHEWEVGSLALSPDGRWIASSGVDRTLRLWDMVTGRPLFIQRGPPSPGPVTFSPDGRHLCSGSEDGTARIWEIPAGRERRVLTGHTDDVLVVAYSPDGRLLATGSEDGTVKLWDPADGREVRVLKQYVEGARAETAVRTRPLVQGHYGPISALAFSPDGRRIATGGFDQTVRIWDVSTGREIEVLKGHTGMVFAVAFAPDGRRLASSGSDSTVRVWELDGRHDAPGPVRLGAGLTQASFFPDGRKIVTARGSRVEVWAVGSGRRLLTLQRSGPAATDLTVSVDGARIAGGGQDGVERVWDARTGRLLYSRKLHTGPITIATFSPDGARVITGGDDGWVREWRPGDRRPVRTLRRHPLGVWRVAFSDDGRRFVTLGASGGASGTVLVWDTSTGRLLFTLRRREGQPVMSPVALSPDGRRLLVGYVDGTATIWDVETGRSLTSLSGHTAAIQHAVFSPDGKRVLTAGHDSSARLWDSVTGRETLVLREHHAPVWGVAFSPDGRRLLSLSADGMLIQREAASAAEITAWIHDERRQAEQRQTTAARREAVRQRKAAAAAAFNDRDSGPAGRTVAGNLLVNGSFEAGPAIARYQMFRAGARNLPGWQVTRGSVDVVGAVFMPSHGVQSLDLNGQSSGGIRQTIPTIPGRRYRLTFDLAGNPPAGGASPGIKRIRVSAGDRSVVFVFDAAGRTFDDMGWVGKQWEFTARGLTTTISFVSLDPDAGADGPALDNIALVAVNPASSESQ